MVTLYTLNSTVEEERKLREKLNALWNAKVDTGDTLDMATMQSYIRAYWSKRKEACVQNPWSSSKDLEKSEKVPPQPVHTV